MTTIPGWEDAGDLDGGGITARTPSVSGSYTPPGWKPPPPPRLRGLRAYVDTHDCWVGYYRGDDHHYVCILPCLVLRWDRRWTYRSRSQRLARAFVDGLISGFRDSKREGQGGREED